MTRTPTTTLRDFAAWYLGGPSWPIAMPSAPLRLHPGGSELVLYRDGTTFQAELIIIRPDFPVPPHRHPHVDALDVNLSGDNRVVIAGRTMPLLSPDECAHPFARRIPVPRNVLHEGETATGSAYLSLQRWHGGRIGFITDDWRGEKW
jgi:hypothetical protein